MKPTVAALALSLALSVSAPAMARSVTLTTTLNDYGGNGAYLAFYVTDAAGAYKGTLWMAGTKAKYYSHLTGWQRDGDSGPVHQGWRTQRMIAAVMQAMRKCPQPIIACAQGPACGGGFSLLLASDVRYAAPDIRMNAAYIKIGLGGCDMGASYFLPRLVGSSVASEYLLTGKFMTADKALACGLVSEVLPHEDLLGKALSLADEMLLTSPMGLRLTKDALNLNIDAASMEHAFGLEDRQQILLSQTADSVEARNAFLEKRAPVWGNR